MDRQRTAGGPKTAHTAERKEAGRSPSRRQAESTGKARRERSIAPAPGQLERLSDLVAGRVQPGPFPAPRREDSELEHWQDPDEFHSPEL